MIPLAIALAAIQAAEAPRAELGDIRMHLFYQGTGRLSPDISPPNEFIGWNTIIGAGSAEEHASDLVIVAEIRAEGHHYVERPLRIVARNENGRILGQRRFSSALTTEAGRAYHALWLNDVSCAGDIRVTVTFGAESRSETLTLPCGE